MRRLILAIVFFAAIFCAASPASAFWGHRGCYRYGGWRGGWCGGYGYGGCGYGGYGWGGYRYGGYYPGYAYRGLGYRGFYRGYGFPNYGYGASFVPGYYAPYGAYNFGYPYYGYGFYGAANRPSTNLTIATLAPANGLPARAAQPAAPLTALALQKFLGLKDIQPALLAGDRAAVVAKPIAMPKSLDDVLARVSNVESRRKAERLIAEGDELFRAQNFHSALQRYKLAVSTAPDVAEALWRQGHALVATHNYELAAKAFKRAVAHTEDLAREGFRLNDIYAGATIAKAQHLEFLAEWALDRDDSSDAYFLLGVFLNYDGQSARAEKFFQKASDLAGISGGHIAVFLDQPAEQPAVLTVPVSTPTEI